MADLGESRFLIDPSPFHANQNDIQHHRGDIPLINSSDDFLHHIQVVNHF